MKKLFSILLAAAAFNAGDASAQTAPVMRVTTCGSNGAGSLPQLVRDAPSGTRIVFDFDCTTVASQFISLDSAMVVRNKNITVDASGHIVVIVACTAADFCRSRPRRVFTVGPAATLRAIHLHMMNGSGETDARSTRTRVMTIGVTTHGGGIYVNLGGTLYLDDSQIVNSFAVEGGGLFNEGTAIINNSEFGGDGAELGGAISNSGNLTLNGSTIAGLSGSRQGEGGGLMNYGTANLINVTVTSNYVPKGAGIFNEGTLTLTNVTLTQNSTGQDAPPTSGNGLLNVGGTVAIANSILSGNGHFPKSPNCVGPVTDGGNNLSFNDVSCGFTINAVSANPQLDTLAWNGGDVRTIALGANSPAIGAGNNALCKHASGYCDIGAYDSKLPPAAPPIAPPVVKSTPAEGREKAVANGTFRVTTPAGNVRGEASYVCADIDGRTKITIILAGGGLMGGLAGTVTKRGARMYEIGEDEERGFTAGFARMELPVASYPAKSGTVTISEWSEARVRGTFTYIGEVEDANGVAQKHTVSGSFNAKPAMGCS